MFDTLHVDSQDGSDWKDAQTDRGLRSASTPLCFFPAVLLMCVCTCM